jgi:sugar lactone lactonase YvrE
LWIADAARGRVIRTREGGEILEEIRLGGGVFCMLGGSDGRTLIMCAAPDFDQHAREASLLAVHVDVPRPGRP